MISRQQRRDMHAIILEQMGEGPHIVDGYDDDSIGCHESHATDEGWSSRTVTVTVEVGRRYVVEVHNAGQDCDGRCSNTDRFVVARMTKRRRWYNGSIRVAREMRTRAGRFGLVNRWRCVREMSGSRWDESAERAGY